MGLLLSEKNRNGDQRWCRRVLSDSKILGKTC